MSYRTLYEFCQDKAAPVSRKIIQPRACELTGVAGVKVFYDDDLPVTALRGYFLSASNQEHRFIKQSGGAPVIVLQRGMNYCWTRFVWVKELMHLFDTALDYVSSGSELEDIITGLSTPPMQRSPQLASEVLCFWRALALLCPEAKRQEYLQRREKGEGLADLQIATELRIPQQYVPSLFGTQFKTIVARLLADPSAT